MQSIKNLLSAVRPVTDKFVTRDFQEFGLRLAEELNDSSRKALYIKLAKTVPKLILEEALSFVKDSNARNKAALFMWKLKALNNSNKPITPISQ